MGPGWLVWLIGCVVPIAPGPDLGACSEPPSGVYATGQVGIGRCIAGPTDLELWTDVAGTPWLAVVNADPFFSFSSGSLLLIDFNSIDLTVDRNLAHEVDSFALALDRFASGFALDLSSGNAIVAGRLSEGAATTAHRDDAAIIDLDDATRPILGDPAELRLEDDPGPALWSTDGFAWVGNLTDHSVSQVQLTDGHVTQIDVAFDAAVVNAAVLDVDSSGSLYSLVDTNVFDPENLVDESWTLTWTDTAWRLWAPEQEGLALWTSGDEEFARSAFGVQGSLTGLTDADPNGALSGLVPLLFTSTGTDILLQVSDGTANGWTGSPTSALRGGVDACPALLSGPSTSIVEGRSALFVDGRDIADGPASIVLALSDDGTTWSCESDSLGLGPSGAWDSVEHPFVVTGAPAQRFRMWMSLRSPLGWSIGLSESDDGRDWTVPEPVAGALVGGPNVAAPAVAYANGRYVMYAAHDVGGSWWLASSISADGVGWGPLVDRFVLDVPYDAAKPPRVALQFDSTGAWRVEGVDLGVQVLPALGAVSWLSLTLGFDFLIAQGYEDAPEGVQPGAVVDVGGRRLMWVTRTDGSVPQLDVLEQLGDRWVAVAEDVIARGTGGNRDGVEGAAIALDGGEWSLFYGARDGLGVPAIRRATSSDGLAYTTSGDELIPFEGSWDAFGQVPHSVETTETGFRLWYSGFDGSTWRIGAATAPQISGPWTLEAGEFDPYQVGTGFPGGIDDSGVRDPLFWLEGNERHLVYSAFDGELWHIGHAVNVDGSWIRRADDLTDLSLPAMSGALGTFSNLGVRSPVALVESDGTVAGWYAGTDGLTDRLGQALTQFGAASDLYLDVWYPDTNYPTPGDLLTFDTTRGDSGISVIELGQIVSDFATTGTGMSSLAIDDSRGFLYVPSKLDDYIYVVDTRDDGDGVTLDPNHHDLEGLLRVENFSAAVGYRDALLAPQHGWLLLLSNSPDAVVVVDADAVPDDGTKGVDWVVPIGTLALPTLLEDEGERSLAPIGGAGMALSPDGSLLLVAHFRGNSVIAFDLTADDFGRELASIPYVGENPHVVRFTPDGLHAVVANYIGEVEDDQVHSTLMVLDTDPSSSTFLEPLTWIVNR